MKQRNDRNYTFVVSHSNRNLIRVRRINVSKRNLHTCLGFAIFTAGIFSYNVVRKSTEPQIASAYNQSESTEQFFPNNLDYQIVGEGGPESADVSSPIDESKARNNVGEKFARDAEHTPSIYPLIGKINDSFGPRRNPFGGSVSEFHPGLDIDGEKGDAVIAPASGVIVKNSWTGGYGNMIEIDHGNGLITRYGHLSQIEVESGETVMRGQEIGKVGSTGRSTGPHLHYEVRVEGEAINPSSYLPQIDLPVLQPQ